MNEEEIKNAIDYLSSPATIRTHCEQIYEYTKQGKSSFFFLHEDKIKDVSEFVAQEILTNYPNLNIPFHSRWRHFDVGGINRLLDLEKVCSSLDPLEKGRCYFELGIISVLLDAGAGDKWHYKENATAKVFQRSEGLAVASFCAFKEGIFAHNKTPYHINAQGLLAISEKTLGEALQVTDENSLLGLQGRLELLNNLGKLMLENSEVFGHSSNPRLGLFFDFLVKAASINTFPNELTAQQLLYYVLHIFSSIWPMSTKFHGIPIGDVGRHPVIKGKFQTDTFVPFHKLSQWLTLSLIEPLENYGIKISKTYELSGLAEYRNGGLFIDSEVLTLRDTKLFNKVHEHSSEMIVEWRALTISLLDKIAHKLRFRFEKSLEELPLGKILQGGTWSAGRKLAKKFRTSGTSPLQVDTKGTIL